MNVLFAGAHPDDIETFCGGTAAKYAARGDKVFFCVSTIRWQRVASALIASTFRATSASSSRRPKSCE